MLSKGGGSLPLCLPLRAAVELDEVRPEQSAGLGAPIRPRKEAAVNGCLVPPQQRRKRRRSVAPARTLKQVTATGIKRGDAGKFPHGP
jgi:hypothetical protein